MSINGVLRGCGRLSSARARTDERHPPGPATAEATGFTLRVNGHGQERRIVLAGELDLRRTREVERAVALACRDGAKELELDLREVTFIDSSGVGEILRAGRQCRESGCALSIVPSEHASPRRVFEILGLENVLAWRVEATGGWG